MIGVIMWMADGDECPVGIVNSDEVVQLLKEMITGQASLLGQTLILFAREGICLKNLYALIFDNIYVNGEYKCL